MTAHDGACVLHADDVHYLLHCLGTIASRLDAVTLLAQPSADLSRALREMEGAERAMRHFLNERLRQAPPPTSGTGPHGAT